MSFLQKFLPTIEAFKFGKDRMLTLILVDLHVPDPQFYYLFIKY